MVCVEGRIPFYLWVTNTPIADTTRLPFVISLHSLEKCAARFLEVRWLVSLELWMNELLRFRKYTIQPSTRSTVFCLLIKYIKLVRTINESFGVFMQITKQSNRIYMGWSGSPSCGLNDSTTPSGFLSA